MSQGFSRREALIPMLGADSGGAVARVAADGDLPAPHQAQLDPELRDLLECGLYQAGQQAKAAVRSLSFSGGGLLGRPAASLSVVNPGDVTGLGSENSASAELGLALALLMFHAQSDERRVVASGALDLRAGASLVQIIPVHHLGRKLRLVAEHFGQTGSAKPPGLFLVPRQDPDGGDTLARYRAEVLALAALGVEVRSVATLAEAAEILGASRIAMRGSERRVRWALAAALLAGVSTALFMGWIRSTVPMRFTGVAAPDGNIVMTPARLVRRESEVIMTVPCQQAKGSLPAFEIGDQIALRVRIDPTRHDLTPRLGGYHYVAVAVSAISLPKIIVPAAGAADDQGAEYVLDVLGPPEDTTLLVLAKRGSNFDADKLRANLIHLLAPLKPAEWDSAARRSLRDGAAGVLTYRFRSVQPGSCS